MLQKYHLHSHIRFTLIRQDYYNKLYELLTMTYIEERTV